MARLPRSFVEALRSGYQLTAESSETQHGKRVGTLHLKNGSRPELVFKYYADRRGYAFSEPHFS